MDDFGLYVIITKPQLSYTKIAEICVENEVRMMQLREKKLTDEKLLEVARQLRSITKGTKTRLVINDRPDIAVLCDADFLHIGQDDIPISEARRITGDMKIGISTHTINQVHNALKQNPDYIGFGPIYYTNAKEKPDPVVGNTKLQQVLEIANIPVVAIGGIFPENVEQVLKTGAKNIALVRYLMQTDAIDERIKELQARI